MFASFTSTLPWSSCGNDWNSPNCVDFTEVGKNAVKSAVNSSSVNATMANTTAIPTMLANMTNATVTPTMMANMTNMTTVPTAIASAARVSASQEYWE